MTTLRVILDDMLLRGGGALARYTEELARALVRAAPRGADVAGVVAASPEDDYARVRQLVPGLRDLHKSALARRELAAAWQRGFTVLPGSGMVHSTSLFAPLRRHDRRLALGEQTVVTIHDSLPWTHPELLPPRQASWAKAMGRRAEKHADAVVVPTHAVAAELAEHLNLSDRVRVIGAAPSTHLTPPADAAERRTARGLPERYVVAVAEGPAARAGSETLAAASFGVPVVVVAASGGVAALDGAHPLAGANPRRGAGSPDGADTPRGAGSPGRADALGRAGSPGRADSLTVVDDADWDDRVAILAGATAYLHPATADGAVSALLDALALRLPVVGSDLPAVSELTDDAAVLVPAGDPGALADAVRALLADETALDRASVASGDRAKAFTWHDAAEKVWQLHADL